MNILIVEDDEATSQALEKFFAHWGFQVLVVADGMKALEVVRQKDFDCMILDMGLPRLDGRALLVHIRKIRPQLPVLILSAEIGVDSRISGLNAGADDYVCKPFSLAEVQARLSAILRRRSASLASVVEAGPLFLDRTWSSALLNGEPLSLSKREFQILEFLMIRHGRLVRKDLIVDHLSGSDAAVTPNLVEVYVHKLRKKLEAAGVQIETNRGLGYILRIVAAPAAEDGGVDGAD